MVGANNVDQFLLAFPGCIVPLVGMVVVVLGVSALSSVCHTPGTLSSNECHPESRLGMSAFLKGHL